MIQLDLTREEAIELTEMLDSTLSDLRFEIADTDRKDFRDHLKRRKALLEQLVETLRMAA